MRWREQKVLTIVARRGIAGRPVAVPNSHMMPVPHILDVQLAILNWGFKGAMDESHLALNESQLVAFVKRERTVTCGF